MRKISVLLFALLSVYTFTSCNSAQAKSDREQQDYSDYIVVSRAKGQWTDFENAVKAQFKKGYKPVGGISSDGTNIFQAMSK